MTHEILEDIMSTENLATNGARAKKNGKSNGHASYSPPSLDPTCPPDYHSNAVVRAAHNAQGCIDEIRERLHKIVETMAEYVYEHPELVRDVNELVSQAHFALGAVEIETDNAAMAARQ